MSWSRQQIRTGGWKRGARFVDELAFTGAIEERDAAREKLATLKLYADLRDALLDDARKACDDADCFMSGFEEEHEDGNADAVREPLRKLRAVLAMWDAEKAPGDPGDVAAMRAAVAARRRT